MDSARHPAKGSVGEHGGAFVALVAAVSGTAVALPGKNTVDSGDIKNKQVRAADLAANAVTSPKVKDGSLVAKDFKPGQLPAGPQGPKGDKGDKGDKGAKGDPGTPAAAGTVRAHAWVRTAPTGPSFNAGFTKGFTAITRPGTGRYCLTPAAGINPDTTPAAVTADWGGSGATEARALAHTSQDDCPAGQFEVRTFDGTTASNAVSFTIIVP